MAKNIPRFPTSQQLDEAVENARKMCEFMTQPQWREQRESLRRLAAKLGQSKPSPHKKPKRKRNKGGGRKPAFTREEIAQLGDEYRRALDKNAKLEDYTKADHHMRQFLAKDRRNVHPVTLKRHVLRPVRGKRTK
jgi:hypothetical protein